MTSRPEKNKIFCHLKSPRFSIKRFSRQRYLKIRDFINEITCLRESWVKYFIKSALNPQKHDKVIYPSVSKKVIMDLVSQYVLKFIIPTNRSIDSFYFSKKVSNAFFITIII
jgi:hypothetical protein